ncbi:Golgin sub A member 7B [Mycoemilia scoparia]|uniref:Ras modification protein ERF4 n=1 Tax=Mycoemilia scoparia TaxID=417184 RepID=A0A9W7ZYI2_9FUNG|nr:Golgin sub A member 7B [Mycoemilia scoparia]
MKPASTSLAINSDSILYHSNGRINSDKNNGFSGERNIDSSKNTNPRDNSIVPIPSSSPRSQTQRRDLEQGPDDDDDDDGENDDVALAVIAGGENRDHQQQQRRNMATKREELVLQNKQYTLLNANINMPNNTLDYGLSKRIRVERDYSKGNACQYSLEFPPLLSGKIDEELFKVTIQKINSLFAEAEGAIMINIMEGILACATFYLSQLFLKPHYQRKLDMVEQYIKKSNDEFFIPSSMGLTNNSNNPNHVKDQDLDKHVADIIAREAKQTREKYNRMGVGAYMQKPKSKKIRTNKVFLDNILNEVKSHNTRILESQDKKSSSKGGKYSDQGESQEMKEKSESCGFSNRVNRSEEDDDDDDDDDNVKNRTTRRYDKVKETNAHDSKNSRISDYSDHNDHGYSKKSNPKESGPKLIFKGRGDHYSGSRSHMDKYFDPNYDPRADMEEFLSYSNNTKRINSSGSGSSSVGGSCYKMLGNDFMDQFCETISTKKKASSTSKSHKKSKKKKKRKEKHSEKKDDGSVGSDSDNDGEKKELDLQVIVERKRRKLHSQTKRNKKN